MNFLLSRIYCNMFTKLSHFSILLNSFCSDILCILQTKVKVVKLDALYAALIMVNLVFLVLLMNCFK